MVIWYMYIWMLTSFAVKMLREKLVNPQEALSISLNIMKLLEGYTSNTAMSNYTRELISRWWILFIYSILRKCRECAYCEFANENQNEWVVEWSNWHFSFFICVYIRILLRLDDGKCQIFHKPLDSYIHNGYSRNMPHGKTGSLIMSRILLWKTFLEI